MVYTTSIVPLHQRMGEYCRSLDFRPSRGRVKESAVEEVALHAFSDAPGVIHHAHFPMTLDLGEQLDSQITSPITPNMWTRVMPSSGHATLPFVSFFAFFSQPDFLHALSRRSDHHQVQHPCAANASFSRLSSFFS